MQNIEERNLVQELKQYRIIILNFEIGINISKNIQNVLSKVIQ